jgi:hypothetical protein
MEKPYIPEPEYRNT